jgi:5-methylcytosine-specific restriction endonuclease McrA
MRLELWICLITAAVAYNTYTEGKYTKKLLAHKKYFQIAFVGFAALCLYLMIKRNPQQTRQLLLYTNNMIKYMPIDKSSIDLVSPIFDLSTRNTPFMDDVNGFQRPSSMQPIPMQHMRRHAQGPQKRSVSETKKKYVASMQDWKCGECRHQLTHTFEIDHKVRLEHGGGNDVGNLVALCRECHGQKTAMENM